MVMLNRKSARKKTRARMFLSKTTSLKLFVSELCEKVEQLSSEHVVASSASTVTIVLILAIDVCLI